MIGGLHLVLFLLVGAFSAQAGAVWLDELDLSRAVQGYASGAQVG